MPPPLFTRFALFSIGGHYNYHPSERYFRQIVFSNCICQRRMYPLQMERYFRDASCRCHIEAIQHDHIAAD